MCEKRNEEWGQGLEMKIMFWFKHAEENSHLKAHSHNLISTCIDWVTNQKDP